MAQNDALNRLQSMMNHTQFPRMEVPRNSGDFASSFANWYNMAGSVMDGIRARNDRNRLQKILKERFGGDESQQQALPQQGGDIIFSAGYTPKENTFGSLLGNGNETPVVNKPSQPDYSLDGFMKSAINSGMSPTNAMAAYNSFIAPLEQDARERNIADAMATLAQRNNGLSREDYYNAMAKLNYNLRKDYAFEDNNNVIKQMIDVQNGLYQPMGLMHDPKKLQEVGYGINQNSWDVLGNTVGTNYGNGLGSYGNNNLSLGGSEYGGDNENARAIYNYLKGKGYSDNVIAGIMGNLKAESQFNPANGYGDGGTSGGLAQWHDEQPGSGRLSNLKNYAVNRNMDWKDLGTQLDFMMDEIKNNYPDLIQKMSNLSPNEAAILFHDVYERSADNPEQKARRGTYADEIFNGRRQGGGNPNVSAYNMATQGSNIDEQVKGLTPEFQQVLPTIGGILKDRFGVEGVISSGARSKERQMQVNPSAPNSYHVYGDAVDIVLPDSTTPEQYKQIEDYFKSTGQFAEVDNHDKGSGYHLHLGGYKGGNIGNTGNVGGQSSPVQQSPSFRTAFAPQVVSGGGAILNPMVAYKAAVEQAERQRQQYNADRNYNRQVYDSDRNYALNRERLNQQREIAEMRNAARTGSKLTGEPKGVSYADYQAFEKKMANGLTTTTPDMSDEEKANLITDKDIENIGKAYAPEAFRYAQKYGTENIGQALRQMYYDKQANPQFRGSTMSPEKMATSIAAGMAEAAQIPATNRYAYIKQWTDDLIAYDKQLREHNEEQEKQDAVSRNKINANYENSGNTNSTSIRKQKEDAYYNQIYNQALAEEYNKRGIHVNQFGNVVDQNTFGYALRNKEEEQNFQNKKREAEEAARKRAEKVKGKINPNQSSVQNSQWDLLNDSIE